MTLKTSFFLCYLHDVFFQNKIWIKESAEQNFMYGNHVYKSGLSRISENTPKYAGVVVLSSKDIPLVRCYSFVIKFYSWFASLAINYYL